MDPVEALIQLGILPPPPGVLGANVPKPYGVSPGHDVRLPQVQEVSPVGNQYVPQPAGPLPPPPAFPPGATPMSAPMPAPAAAPAPNPAPTIDPNLAPVSAADALALPPGGGEVDPYAALATLTEWPTGSGQPGPARASAPPASAPAKASGSSPAPSAPRGQPPAAPTASPAMPSTEPAGSSAMRDPGSRERLWQMLAIMGAVLSQPTPAGSNPMGQLGKALGMGVLYQDAMSRADQDRADKAREVELAQRRLGVQEKSLGIDMHRADTARMGAQTDQAVAGARIQTMLAGLPGIVADAELTKLKTRAAAIALERDPAKRALEEAKLLADIEQTRAQTEYTRTTTGTPQARSMAKLTELLQKGGAIVDGQPFDIDKAVTITGINGAALGLKPMTPQQVARGQEKYKALVANGMSPADAEQMLYSEAVQSSVIPRRWGTERPR